MVLASILVAFTVNCKEKTQQNIDTTNGVFIEKMEATSVSLDGIKYGPQNVFGGGEWRSYPVSNGGEGMMIYFLDESNLNTQAVRLGSSIHSLKVNCSNVKRLKLYVNGSVHSYTDCGTTKQMEANIRSLFIQGVQDRAAGAKPMIISSIEFYDQNGEKRPVVFPRPIVGAIKASSTLAPQEAYRPYFIFDGRTGFGWVEGKSDAGIGEGISISLNESIKITGMEIYTGYQRSPSHFEKNAAPTSLTISGDDNKPLSVTLANQMDSQRVQFSSPITGKNISIKIAGVRKGSKWQDTVISEITFLDGNNRYTIFDPASIQNAKSTLEQIKGSSLEQVVGNNLQIITDCEMDYFKKQLLLRPNGSFVYWDIVELDDGEKITNKLRDGNWLVKNVGADKSVIEIFGRYKEIEKGSSIDYDEPYGSENRYQSINTEKDYIFSDKNMEVTVSPFTIEEPYLKMCNGEGIKYKVHIEGSTISTDLFM